jgi:hypothetical protein
MVGASAPVGGGIDGEKTGMTDMERGAQVVDNFVRNLVIALPLNNGIKMATPVATSAF